MIESAGCGKDSKKEKTKKENKKAKASIESVSHRSLFLCQIKIEAGEGCVEIWHNK